MGVYQSFSGREAQVSYAATNSIALMANYNNMRAKKTTYSLENYNIDKHYFGEVGLGLYKKDTAKKGKIREVFFIVGKGMTSHYWQGLDSSSKLLTSFRQG